MPTASLKVDLQNLISAMLRQYRNKNVLIRETIQNAVDAGAKSVRISIAPKLIEIEDDGHGMGAGDIDDYWNVIARTSKREQDGAIGEFGLGRLALLIVSDRMFMETRKGKESFRVVTERSGRVTTEAGNRSEQGTRVWVEGDFSEYVADFVEYANVVAKSRREKIEVNGTIVSRKEYLPPKDCPFSMPLKDKDMAGVLWIPAEALDRRSRSKEREATIRLYVNDLFVKDLSTDYYIFGDANCDELKVVTSRDDVVVDGNYRVFQDRLVDFIETKFYSGVASNSTLVNDARIRNDILQAASKHSDKGLIENMMFERTSGERVTGSQLSSQKDIFVVSETNVGDMRVGDTFDKLGEGVSIVAPTGLKKLLEKTIGTIKRSEVSQIVTERTRGEPASPREMKQFVEVGELIASLSGFKVEYRKNVAAEAEHTTGKIIININSAVVEEARKLISDGRRDLAAVRLIGIVAHEMAHEQAPVHNVGFYELFENKITSIEDRVIRIFGGQEKRSH